MLNSAATLAAARHSTPRMRTSYLPPQADNFALAATAGTLVHRDRQLAGFPRWRNSLQTRRTECDARGRQRRAMRALRVMPAKLGNCSGPSGRGVLGFLLDRTRQGRTILRGNRPGRLALGRPRGHNLVVERTQGLPWKDVQAFAGGSDKAAGVVNALLRDTQHAVDGEFAGRHVPVSRPRRHVGITMGRGANTDTKEADQ